MLTRAIDTRNWRPGNQLERIGLLGEMRNLARSLGFKRMKVIVRGTETYKLSPTRHLSSPVEIENRRDFILEANIHTFPYTIRLQRVHEDPTMSKFGAFYTAVSQFVAGGKKEDIAFGRFLPGFRVQAAIYERPPWMGSRPKNTRALYGSIRSLFQEQGLDLTFAGTRRDPRQRSFYSEVFLTQKRFLVGPFPESCREGVELEQTFDHLIGERPLESLRGDLDFIKAVRAIYIRSLSLGMYPENPLASLLET